MDNRVEKLPSLYEYYTENGIKSGLEASGDNFILNGKKIQILGGSLHYFRVVPEQWQNRLIKMRACGLNTVELYVPWNLHEEHPGKFDFGDFLDLRKFLKEVKEADMFVLLRPGPYICSEWEFGGLPSWLLRDTSMQVRSNYQPFKEAVKKYFSQLIPLVSNFQFSKNGGPIIAVQIENEFASFGNTEENDEDLEYMIFVKSTMEEFGIKELFFTSDEPISDGHRGSIPGVLMTANFKEGAEKQLNYLKKMQLDKPLLVAEYWSGWFDHWTETHNVHPAEAYAEELKNILKLNSSVNIYMFHGGTNFGFLNGANVKFPHPEIPYSPTITSYDYDAPLTESGDYTVKYFKTREIIKECCSSPKLRNPPLPYESKKMSLLNLTVSKILPWAKITGRIKPQHTVAPVNMEILDLGNNFGQNFGFVMYRTKVSGSGILILSGGVADRAVIYWDGSEIAVVNWLAGNMPKVELPKTEISESHTLDVLVENLGRINYGMPDDLNNQRKGLRGPVYLNEQEIHNWTVFPLTFDKPFIQELEYDDKWEIFEPSSQLCRPALYKIDFQLSEKPLDTFLYSESWQKGVVFVNGFNIGRYWKVGPQQTLYVPSPLLRYGDNTVLIFELHNTVLSIDFLDHPILDQNSP
ncbi:beta-galactosidase-1-like protein 2 [Tachypleus tridentatus]|uniref:beta-galactosidase-1-like protein 2 n=1 Tax=Tachypleus tridentatus TaxID=6853 RepID=UPI003FCF1B93